MNRTHPHRSRLGLPLALLLAASLACSLPTVARPTSTPSLPPTLPVSHAFTPSPATDLPPAVVETSPLPGSEIALQETLRIAFNQPMDKRSVEAAVSSSPSVAGRFTWEDDATLAFTPDQPLLPAARLALTVGTQARAANGQALPEPVTVQYLTGGPLRLVQALPAGEAVSVDPTSAVVAAFNYPVVPLGQEADAPAAFTLEPQAPGRGQWINTSTYIFYPDTSLDGGRSYTATLNPDLQSLSGAPLEEGSPASWSFTTALPQLTAVSPMPPAPLPLDGPITLDFNIAMDPVPLEQAVTLRDGAGAAVPGDYEWDDTLNRLTFTPTSLLARGTPYILRIAPTAASWGGTPLNIDQSYTLATYPTLTVTGTKPSQGQLMEAFNGFGTASLIFSAPLKAQGVQQYVSVSPEVGNFAVYLENDTTAVISGYFQPSTIYTITVAPELPDKWGGTLGQPYTLTFGTPAAAPSLVTPGMPFGSSVVTMLPGEAGVSAQATNLSAVTVEVGALPLADLFRMLGPEGYAVMQGYRPPAVQSWSQPLAVAPDRSEGVSLPLTQSGNAQPTGLYFMRAYAAELGQNPQPPSIVAVSGVNLTFKLGEGGRTAVVWAVDLAANQPLAGAPVTIYSAEGQSIVEGTTDERGILETDLPAPQDPFASVYAVSGEPGAANFGIALSTWDAGISGWDFDLRTDYQGPGLRAYLTTDRPIYRPGQTVYYKGIVRQAQNGRYTLPEADNLTLVITGDPGMTGEGPELVNEQAFLSGAGTFDGELALSPEAAPGNYQIAVRQGETVVDMLNFQVANYRKPEVDLTVDIGADAILSGTAVEANVQARYFFGAPAADRPVTWRLYRQPERFTLPQYQVGPEDTGWLRPGWEFGGLGAVAAEGQGRTGSDGRLAINLRPEEWAAQGTTAGSTAAGSPERLTLEVAVIDDSGLPVLSRAEVTAHPAPLYIGVRPDAWSAQAGAELGFDIQTVDPGGQPVGEAALDARFDKVTWVEKPSGTPFEPPAFEAQLESAGSASPTTDAEGRARLVFTPPSPGAYRLEVTSAGEGGRTALTQVTVWVGGAASAAWPNIPNQHIRLTADKVSYQAGDTARVFVPNPFGQSVPMLVTHERGEVMAVDVTALEGAGAALEVPLTAEHAPNVYLSVTLLGKTPDGRPDFRQGYVELVVEPKSLTLNVQLTAQPEQAAPGQPVTLSLLVTDADGQPVQGEFSLSVVDLAALALAEPNSSGIVDAFYSPQPLGVRTGLTLAVYAGRAVISRPGGGGGGDGGLVPVEPARENFADTAYWNAAVTTGADGRAEVTLTLPGNLTTWQTRARGFDTGGETVLRVGEAALDLTASRELMVRPQTPRFLTAGDHVELAAVVNNATAGDLPVEVSLSGAGFTLDDPASATQAVTVAANGQARVSWWGTAQNLPAADLTFSARAGSLTDASTPTGGPLPILRYSSPQIFSTSGVLAEPGERLEVVSVPEKDAVLGGSLSVELSPSLAAGMLSGLERLAQAEGDDTATVLSRFLPALEAARALQDLGLTAPGLDASLDQTVQASIARLAASQNPDGGWDWQPVSNLNGQAGTSDATLSAYALLGLSRAAEAGYPVSPAVIERAVAFLSGIVRAPGSTMESWELDQTAFILFALKDSGSEGLTHAANLYEIRDRLSPGARALLALTLQTLTGAPEGGAEDERVTTLMSDLGAGAIRSSTGAHWETEALSWAFPGSAVLQTAQVVYAAAQLDPGAAWLPDAVRWLMSSRSASGDWGSPNDSAWALMALTRALRGTGDLQSGFAFLASLNGSPLARGQAGGPNALTTVRAEAPLDALNVGPNGLLIQHDIGSGRLYYRADLRLDLPAEEAQPVNRGMTVARRYTLSGEDEAVSEISLANEGTPPAVTAHITLTLPHDVYYLVVEDYAPAGMEILNPRLKTTQQGAELGPGAEAVSTPTYDPGAPYEGGWGWWLFDEPDIFDDHIRWSADALPAGTYELTYTLLPFQPGEFRALPARAWQFYFPEVQGSSAGDLFTIRREE